MKRTLFATLCVAALPLAARAQASVTPQASAASPTTVSITDTAPPAAKKWEIRFGGFMVNGERNTVFNNQVQTTTGSVKGVEAVLRGSGGGIQVRSSASVFNSKPDVVNADASLLLGVPSFTFMLGGAKRALTSTLGTQIFTFARLGVQMTFTVGGTGLRGQIGGWGYVPGPDDQDRMEIGGEGEASILYSPPRVPLFIQLGYRNEVFKAKTATTVTPEEIRGLRLGAGIQFGGK